MRSKLHGKQRYRLPSVGVELKGMMALGRQVTLVALGALLYAAGSASYAQDAKQVVQQAVNAELAANRDDDSHWRYIDHRADEDRGTYVVVETAHGALKRHIEENGKPASAAILKEDNDRIEKFIHDPALQQKQKRDGAHDDKSAAELTDMLPRAFLWSITRETPETVTLAFKPDPNFHPPDIEARVMGAMVGTLVVDKAEHRIRTMKGELGEDVYIGYGILGRLRKGGTFDVERRRLAPGLWQITETHVHIEGRALFFKSIGQQQDEVKTDFTPVPLSTTLEQAVTMLDLPH
jgi:hypothetical protein